MLESLNKKVLNVKWKNKMSSKFRKNKNNNFNLKINIFLVFKFHFFQKCCCPFSRIVNIIKKIVEAIKE